MIILSVVKYNNKITKLASSRVHVISYLFKKDGLEPKFLYFLGIYKNFFQIKSGDRRPS